MVFVQLRGGDCLRAVGSPALGLYREDPAMANRRGGLRQLAQFYPGPQLAHDIEPVGLSLEGIDGAAGFMSGNEDALRRPKAALEVEDFNMRFDKAAVHGVAGGGLEVYGSERGVLSRQQEKGKQGPRLDVKIMRMGLFLVHVSVVHNVCYIGESGQAIP